jgi:hypothetical protein
MPSSSRSAYYVIGVALVVCVSAISYRVSAQARPPLSAPFTPSILKTSPEAPFHLRFFTTAVKTDSEGRIITGLNDDPVKTLVGAEFAGERAGQQRFS